MKKDELTHFDEAGRGQIVDVSEKKATNRLAIACGAISMKKETLQKIIDGEMKKGDVLAVAQVAGMMAVKRTPDLIPMCHNIFISGSAIEFEIDRLHSQVKIKASVKNTGQTGVEIEALTAVSITALTIYDMCKAIDREMIIEKIYLKEKSGGQSGKFIHSIENKK